MSIEEAIQILKAHNEWQRSEDETLDEVIDLIVASYEGLPSQEQFNRINDLRPYLLAHPDGEMVHKSCLHNLGDAHQQFDLDKQVTGGGIIHSSNMFIKWIVKNGYQIEKDGEDFWFGKTEEQYTTNQLFTLWYLYLQKMSVLVEKFANKNDIEFSYWVADEVGGVACFNEEFYISGSALEFDITTNQPKHRFIKYHYYLIEKEDRYTSYQEFCKD